MGIFPENPCEYAVEFVRKMRIHPDIVQMPSSRQVLSIPKLILARFYRKGAINPNDFIEISAMTSFPDNQELAKKIAFEILFPNYKKNSMSTFFEDESSAEDNVNDEFLNQDLKSELDQIQDLIDEIEFTKSTDTELINQMEQFIDELNKNRNSEPYESALHFFNDDSELFKQKISSLDKLIEEAKKKLEEKINSLTPSDLKAGERLNLNDLIQEKSKRSWEKITSKALNNQDIVEDLKNLLKNKNLEDFIQSLKFLKESQAISKEQIDQMKNALESQIRNLDQLFQAAKNLGEVPKFDLNEVLSDSLEQTSFEHNFNVANSLDQYFGTNLRAQLLDKYNDQNKNSEINLSLESLMKSAFANKSWNDLLNQTLQNAMKEAMKEKKKFEAFKDLSHQLQQMVNSCANPYCSQKMEQYLPKVIQKSIESCDNANELKNVIEFLRNLGLNPESEDIKKAGKRLQMSEDEIYELIEPNYQLLKNLIDKRLGDFERISKLLNQIKDQITKDRIKELLASALASDNRSALGALGHFNLEEALKSASQIGGEKSQDKLIQCLSAGKGENLLKQWFIHRQDLPIRSKEKVKELAKQILIELGIYYSRAMLGSSISGPIPINVIRPFTIGDDFDNVDMEETINNILEKGKSIDHINYDDFFVYETARGLRSACFELDISGSMSGDKLAYMSICVAMLIYSFHKDELGITFFESDTHVLKEINEKIDLEKIADEILSIQAKGGTMLSKSLEWALRQFREKSTAREKLNVLFTDAEVYDLQQAMEKLRIFRSMNVDFILVVPEVSYNLEDAKKIVKITGGQLLTIKDWNEFPKLVSDIIKSKF